MHLLKNLYLFQSIHITIASIPRNWFSHIIRRTIYEPIIIYFATSIFCPPITYCNQFDQIHYQTYGKIWCPVQIGKIITFNPIILILIYVVPRWWNISCERLKSYFAIHKLTYNFLIIYSQYETFYPSFNVITFFGSNKSITSMSSFYGQVGLLKCS